MIGEKIELITKNSDARVANEAAAISEAIPAFAYKLCPDQKSAAEHISFCKDSAEYYLNRVRNEARIHGKESEWANSLLSLFALLQELASNPIVRSSSECISSMPLKASSSGQKPKVHLQGNKWIVENGNSFDELVEIKPESMNQSVIIEKCENLLVRITGKVSAVAVNRCKRLKLEMGDVVSSVEATSTLNSDFFLEGKAPTIVLDNSEAVRLHLSEHSREAQVMSSKCAEINLVVPQKILTDSSRCDPDDVVEIALPFQFKSTLNPDGTIHTEAVQHSGA